MGPLKIYMYPDSKVHVANMGPTWGQQDPGVLHVGHMNFAIWVYYTGKLEFFGVLFFRYQLINPDHYYS